MLGEKNNTVTEAHGIFQIKEKAGKCSDLVRGSELQW